jgi:hypothetical protein
MISPMYSSVFFCPSQSSLYSFCSSQKEELQIKFSCEVSKINVIHVVTNNSLCSCTFAAAVRLLDYLSCVASGRILSDNSSSSDELVDELFTIFDDVRMTAVKITDTILKFIGELRSF